MNTQRFSYTPSPVFPKLHSGLPCMPITLLHGEQTIKLSALVDSGASISVLPYDVVITGRSFSGIYRVQS